MIKISNYENIRNQLYTGDCILVKGKGIISRIIRLYTEYSHTYIIIRPKEYEELKDRIFLLEAHSVGVRMVLLSDVLEKKSGDFYIFQPFGLTDTMRKRILIDGLIASASQIKYNFKGLFKNLLKRTSISINNYFCSELVWVKWIKCGFITPTSYVLTEEGVFNVIRGISPRPCDIPKWVYGTLTKINKGEN